MVNNVMENRSTGFPLSVSKMEEYVRGIRYGNKNILGFTGICIDSRKAQSGELFVPLSGSRVDGHFFIESAFENGCSGCLINRSFFQEHESKIKTFSEKFSSLFIIVDNTLHALQDAAAGHMDSFPKLVRVGVTGSSGKTTTKEMIGSILSQRYKTAVAEGNFNSEIGLCIEALKVTGEHTHAVFEMGINRPGEMDVLARVVKPDYAIITNIGSAHIGLLGGKAEIAAEKKKIFSRFTGNETGFLREDEPFRELLTEGVEGVVKLYGKKSTPGIGGVRTEGILGSEITYEEKTFTLPLPGEHNLINALGAISLCRELLVSREDIASGLGGMRSEFGRSEIIRGMVTVIQDCYNANPESTAAAISMLGNLTWEGRKIVVLGDMKELGAFSPDSHRETARSVAHSGADYVYFVGEEFNRVFEEEELRNCISFAGDSVIKVCSSMDEILLSLKEILREGDLVLVKGSRSMALEEVVKEIVTLGRKE